MVQRVDPLRWNSPVVTEKGFPTPFFLRQWSLVLEQLGDNVLTLSNSGVVAGTYGGANELCQVTVGADGRITSADSFVLPEQGLTQAQVLARVSTGV